MTSRSLLVVFVLCFGATMAMAQGNQLVGNTPEGSICTDFVEEVPNPNNPNFVYQGVHQLLRTGNYTQAAALLAPLLNEPVVDDYALFLNGCTLWGLEQVSEATMAFENYVLNGNDVALLVEAGALVGFPGGRNSDRRGAPMRFDRNGTPEDILVTFEETGIIPSGGMMATMLESITLPTEDGTPFETIDLDATVTNFIMGATLSFATGGEQAMCGIAGHVGMLGEETVDDVTTSFIDRAVWANVDSTGMLILEEASTRGNITASGTVENQNTTTARPIQLTLLVMDAIGYMYTNGEFTTLVDLTGGFAGGWAVRLDNAAMGTTCTASNVFIYTLPTDAVDGVCTITAQENVNKRIGPSEDLERQSFLARGEVQTAIGQALQVIEPTEEETEAGAVVQEFVWWQLEDGGWVREDFVQEMGFCRELRSI